MALTLTGLIPTLMAASEKVSREMIGIIPSVTVNSQAIRAAVGQSITSAVTPTRSSRNITAASTVPALTNLTYGTNTFTISKSKGVPVEWSGEEQMSVDAQGRPVNLILKNDFANAMRILANEVEVDLGALYTKASRATGTSGTTPFASTLADAAALEKILDDNGAPLSGRSLVINTTAGAALRTLGQLTKANEAGTAMTLRDGELLNLHGFSVRESAQINNATAGTGSGYLINEASGYAVGATSLTLDTGTGTILAGDVITIGSHKYVVKTALAANVVVIQSPGLVAAVANNAEVTVNATSARNIAFSSDAIVLATRLPIFPSEGDMAIDNEVVTDPRTGISFDLRVYPGDGMVLYRIHALWGWQVLKSAHAAVLLG